jgi:predicted secreted protein
MKPLGYIIFSTLIVLSGLVLWLVLRKRKKKTIIMTLGLIIFFFSGIWFYNYINNRNYYEVGTCKKFTLKIGETISIKIRETPSTGFGNCWINESNCQSVKLLDREYSIIWYKKRSPGAPGQTKLTFIGTKTGTDTIKISSCPTGRMGKDCNYFSEDSVRLHHENIENLDYIFIATVKDN